MQGLNASDMAILTDPPASAVDQQLNRVRDQCIQLEGLIAGLFDKLKPVLTPPSPLACAGECASKAQLQSPLSDQIGCVAYKLEANADALRDLLVRLEV